MKPREQINDRIASEGIEAHVRAVPQQEQLELCGELMKTCFDEKGNMVTDSTGLGS